MNETILFYDAFISYRHVEPDQTIARKLFNLLEHYQTPKALSRKGVPSKLTRVFRDEEELPTSKNLSESIQYALEKSKYLIVLCSEETPKSKYVAQEIEIFKALGREDRILAVLIGEDATKCFPKELLGIKDLTILNKERENKLTVDIEPLAANIHDKTLRGMLKKLEDKEKLRLLAPMLGCSFDDLYGREVKRKSKRVLLSVASTVLTALLIFALLFLNHANQKRSAQANLLNEIDQNLENMNTIVRSMKLIFQDKTLQDDLEQQRAGLISGDINSLLHYSYLATIVQGQIDSLDTLLREQQFAKEDKEISNRAKEFFNNGTDIGHFFEKIPNIEEEGYDLISNCKNLQEALNKQDEQAVQIYMKSIDVNLNMYEKYCESALISGAFAAQSTGASIDRLNEMISIFDDTLQFQPITETKQLTGWMGNVTSEMAALIAQKSQINLELSVYLENLLASYTDKMNELITISESDSIDEARRKILSLAAYGRLEEVQAGLDYFESKFVTKDNPTDQVFVDTARRFMPLYINGKIDCNGGVCVLSVTKDSVFETEGFVAGDVILRYNDTETVTADELIDAQQKAKQEVNQVEIQYVHFNEDGSYQVITKTIPSSGTGAWFCSI